MFIVVVFWGISSSLGSTQIFNVYLHNFLPMENSMWTLVKLRCLFFSSIRVLFQSIPSTWIGIILTSTMCIVLSVCWFYFVAVWDIEPMTLCIFNLILKFCNILLQCAESCLCLNFSPVYSTHLFEWSHHTAFTVFHKWLSYFPFWAITKRHSCTILVAWSLRPHFHGLYF